jgi:hypothetical protein
MVEPFCKSLTTIMNIPPETYTVTLTEDDLEMILNALSYEHETHTEITQEYRDALEALHELIDRVGNPWRGDVNAGNDAKQG